MKIELSNESIPEGYVRAFQLRVHEKAEFSFEEFKDKIDLTLVNKETGTRSERAYFKLKGESLTIYDTSKIDTILYFMHRDIGIDLWED